MSCLTSNEIETLRRWSNDPSVFSPQPASHRDLLRRAADELEKRAADELAKHAETDEPVNASSNESALARLLDALPDSFSLVRASSEYSGEEDEAGFAVASRVSVTVAYSEMGVGFGEISLVRVGGRLFLNTERAGRDEAKRVFARLLDSAVTDVDPDPVSHAAYKTATSTTCGPACPACRGASEVSS